MNEELRTFVLQQLAQILQDNTGNRITVALGRGILDQLNSVLPSQPNAQQETPP
jgi:hypothetical protein